MHQPEWVHAHLSGGGLKDDDLVTSFRRTTYRMEPAAMFRESPTRDGGRRSMLLRLAAMDRSHVASLLLLLPLAVVAICSGVGIDVNDSASKALDNADQIGIQLSTTLGHVHEVALTGTSLLVGDAHEDIAAMGAATSQVETGLTDLASLPGMSAKEVSALDIAQRAWDASANARQAVLQTPANGSASTADRHALEDQLNARLSPVSAELQTLDALNASDVSSREQVRSATELVSAIAVVVAVVVGFIGALWLLRMLRERQEAVRRRERRFAALVEHASDGILVIASSGAIIFVTPAFSEEFALDGMPTFNELIHVDDQEQALKAWHRVISGGPGTVSEIEARLHRRDGEWRHVWTKLTNRLDDPAVDGVVLNVTDVSERHEFEGKLTHQAMHDALTGLPNRELLRRRMEYTMGKFPKATHTLVYLDCDDFKRINDTLGHAAGDRFLIEVGVRLAGCVRPEDTVARVGGDEFAILLESTDAAVALRVTTRIMGALRAPFVIEGTELLGSASIGVASGFLSPSHPETLVADADLAMYFAKRSGKGGYSVFADRMRTELVDRISLGEDLRRAIEAGGLTVAYQPIIELRTGMIVGAEALARWNHPLRGCVVPDTFIPLAEELGLVDRIDVWVLRSACAQGRAWLDAGLDQFKMAVNISGRDLDQPDLVDQIATILRDTGFPAGHLELELTEGVAINQSTDAVETLKALKSLGLQLAIDDFGTGYSALSRLRDLPFDRLKVDKAFVDDIASPTTGPVLVDTILQMAHVLGMEVVAEGVETGSQADYLRDRHCDFAQGYHFNRPMSQGELGHLLLDQRAAVAV
jgi:diguanylate cyclase (GGDEF)-like protein/PAS domain S-box-containing protein